MTERNAALLQAVRNNRNLFEGMIRALNERSPESAKSHILRWAYASIEDTDQLLAALAAVPAHTPGALDVAWREAEAALPEGWWIEKVYLRERGTRLETFSAWARRPDSDGGLRGDGETPQAALLALATTLADTPSVRGRVTNRALDQRLKVNRAASPSEETR